MYGIVNSTHLRDCAILACDVLGHGKNNKAVQLLLETCNAESKMGKYKDTTKYAGIGVNQFDKIAFDDVLDRVRLQDVAMIKEKLDIELSWIKWEDLRYNPLLSMLFTRLKYKKIPEEIPATKGGRALYWKTHYNTVAGKGTIEHYLA